MRWCSIKHTTRPVHSRLVLPKNQCGYTRREVQNVYGCGCTPPMIEVATPSIATRPTNSSLLLVKPSATRAFSLPSPISNCCALMSLPAVSAFLPFAAAYATTEL